MTTVYPCFKKNGETRCSRPMDFQGDSCFETGKIPKIQAASRKRPRAAKMKNEGAGDSDDERKVGAWMVKVLDGKVWLGYIIVL